MIRSFISYVVSNRMVSPQTCQTIFRVPHRGNFGHPGQFVHLRLPGMTTAAILRRPFSIHRSNRDRLWLLYQVKGSVTQAMSRLKRGDSAEMIGPLGHGFRPARNIQEHLLVAGGMGLAPMFFLADRLKEAKMEHRLLFGCRSSAHLLPTPARCLVSSDDGSCGETGAVTSILERELERCTRPSVYACGPWPMLKATAFLCRKYDIPCQVSLESFMACGVGACQGCVVRGSDGGYLTVCEQGPVFEAELIDWDQENIV